MSRWQRFWHLTMDWHRAPVTGFDGASCTGRCPVCKRRLLMDSNGDWFSASRQEARLEQGGG